MIQRIAVLGAGVMGETLLAAILRSGHPADHIVISEKRAERAAELSGAYGVDVVSNVEAVADADVVLLVVKPQDVPALLAEVAPSIRPGSTVVSLAAGVLIESIQAALPDGVAVVRVMPNTPALVGEGMFGVSAGPSCSTGQLETVVALLRSGGRTVVIDEEQQNALTALSGSGPAYVFYLVEAMVAGGVELGLDAEVARELAQQTLVGSAALLASSDADATELRRRVTSPHGTTAAAVAVFDERGVSAAVVAGMRANADRAAELSANP